MSSREPHPLGNETVEQELRRLLGLGTSAGGPSGTGIPPTEVTSVYPGIESDPPAPETLGRYAILGELGRGGMGTVLAVRDHDLARQLAAKVVSRDRDERHLARFVLEARITGHLQHPNIVPVHEIGKTPEGRFYFTMKAIEGQTLHAKLHGSSPPPLNELVRILIKVCDAIAFAHSHGIIHRDLKPANIMIGQFGEVQVMDWGLAKVLGQPELPSGDPEPRLEDDLPMVGGGADWRTVPDTILGTPSYMPREQAFGRIADLDRRSDTYSLGAILYEILANTPPHTGSTREEILHRVRTTRAVPPSERAPKRKIPRDMEAIAVKALEPEQADRYQDVASFQADLEAYLEHRSVSVSEFRLAPAMWKWARRNPAKAVGILGLLVALGGGLYEREKAWRLEEDARRVEDERISGLIVEDAADRGMIRIHIRTGEYEKASETLARDLHRLRGEEDPRLARRREEIRAQLDRIRALASFRSDSAAAWFRAGQEADDQARGLCQKALAALGIEKHPAPEWWEGLPVADLLEEGAVEIRGEVYRLLILQVMLMLKPKIMGKPEEPAVIPVLQSIWAAEGKVEGIEPSRTSQILGVAAAPEDGLLQFKAMATKETTTDYFFIGLLGFFLRHVPEKAISDTLLGFLPRIGVKPQDPLPGAERRFRVAASLDPRGYWPSYMHGWTLRSLGDRATDRGGDGARDAPGLYRQSELAFAVCISLQPDNARGREARALVIAKQSKLEDDPRLKSDLVGRAEEESRKAVLLSPDDPATYWSRGDLKRELGEDLECLQAYARALELDKRITTENISRRPVLDIALDYAEEIIEDRPKEIHPDAHKVIALVHATLHATLVKELERLTSKTERSEEENREIEEIKAAQSEQKQLAIEHARAVRESRPDDRCAREILDLYGESDR